MTEFKAVFKPAYRQTINYEGGYSNNPKDRGGETYKGISRKHWASWPGWKIIDDIKVGLGGTDLEAELSLDSDLEAAVQLFYKMNFWGALNCAHMPQEIANELFDTSVNTGTVYGAKCLQNALNKLNRNQRDFDDLIVDGGIGEKTLSALESYLATSRFKLRNCDKLVSWLLKWMNYYQLQKYDKITNADLEQEIFVPGWTDRV